MRQSLRPKWMSSRSRRRGYSLLELIVAMTLLSVVMTATTSLLRTSRQAWEAHEADLSRTRTAHSLVRQMLREIRDADEIVAITVGTSSAPRLRIRQPDGTELEWQHSTATRQVTFLHSRSAPQSMVVAEDITSVTFEAIRVDGASYSAAALDRIQGVKVSVEVTLPRGAGVSRKAVGTVWLRAFGRSRPG